jgi:FSR family fosmidomycin resistance protein-like MFS transporter
MAMVTFAAVLTPMRESIGAGLFAISVVGNISYFSFGLLAPASGFLSDRIGSRRVLVLCCLGMAAGCVGVAVSHNIYALGASLGVLGLAAALYHPAGLSLVARRVAGVEKAMAYHGILGTLGLALGPVVAGAITAGFGWRWSYVALAAALAGLGAAFAALARGGGRRLERATAGAVNLPQKTLLGALLLFYVIAVMNGFIFHGATTFLPTRLASVKNLFVGNVATTATLLVGIAGQYVGGLLASRWRYELVLAASFFFSGVALLFLGTFQGAFIFAPALAYGFAHFSTQPVTNTLVSRLASARRQGIAFGVNFFLAFGLGSLGTGFVGYVGERFNLGEGFAVLGLVGFLALPFTFVLWLLRRRAAAAPKIKHPFTDIPR